MTAAHGNPPGSGDAARSGHHHRHGNPEDLAAYIAKMEDPARDLWQKPDQVVRALAPLDARSVCDIGAGSGYFALRLGRAVGAQGHVWAVDVEPHLLGVLRERIQSAGATKVTPVLGLPDDPRLPAGACDLILIVDTFHHFPDGTAYLKRLGRALKTGGRLVNVDFHKRELPVGPALEHKVAREDFLRHAEQAGFKLLREHGFLPYQYFLVLTPSGG